MLAKDSAVEFRLGVFGQCVSFFDGRLATSPCDFDLIPVFWLLPRRRVLYQISVGDRLPVKLLRPEWDATKSAALYMLKNGLVSYKEIAELSGFSKQVVRVWGVKVDAPKARKRYLQQAWTRAKRSRG